MTIYEILLILIALSVTISAFIIGYFCDKLKREYPVNCYKNSERISDIFTWGLCIIPTCMIVVCLILEFIKD